MRRILIVLSLVSCNYSNTGRIAGNVGAKRVNEIPLPSGFERVKVDDRSFGSWLREVELKSDNTVYLYNGSRKQNQQAQFAVLDITVGKKDLQQCADAVMRLRAEYLKFVGKENEIAFYAGDGTLIDYRSWKEGYRFHLKGNRLVKVKSGTAGNSFSKYLEIVFNYCSTITLSKELQSIDLNEILPGDVLIQPGAPGHAVIVADVAINQGRKKFVLAQSYMPAQDIHLLRNPLYEEKSTPWFDVPSAGKIYTPEWVFSMKDLKRFR